MVQLCCRSRGARSLFHLCAYTQILYDGRSSRPIACVKTLSRPTSSACSIRSLRRGWAGPGCCLWNDADAQTLRDGRLETSNQGQPGPATSTRARSHMISHGRVCCACAATHREHRRSGAYIHPFTIEGVKRHQAKPYRFRSPGQSDSSPGLQLLPLQ